VSIIPKALTLELEKLVRERDHFERLAADRAPVDSDERKQEIEARDKAVRELLFLVAIEGIDKLSRGGKGCVWRAVELLRPDVSKVWGETDDPHATLHRFFPDPEDLK
jgi:hypothetical protein